MQAISLSSDRRPTVRALGASLFVASVALTSGSSAVAQVASPSGGPPTGSDRVSVLIRGDVSYDSNVAGGDNTVATIRHLNQQDVSYDLGTTFAFQLPSSRETLFLTGAADIRRYQRNQVLNSEDYQVSGGATGRIGFCSATAIASYARRQSLIENLAVAVDTNTVELPSAQLSLSCAEGRLIESVSGSVSRQVNQQKRAGFVDSRTEGGGASVGYRNARLGDISVTANYSKVDYDTPSQAAFPNLTSPSFQSYGAGLRYSRKIGLRLSGTAEVSYNHLEATTPTDSLNGAAANANSIGANASLAYRVSPRLGLTLDYNLANQASPLLNTSYERTEQLQFSGNYRVSQRISLHAAVQRSREEYRGGQVDILQLRTSDQTTVDGGVAFKIGRKVSLTLDASHSDRRADISEFDYNSDQVTLGLTTKF